MKIMRKAALGGVVLMAASVLAACGDAPEETGKDGGNAAKSDFLPCIVSDAGGFDDKSFNQLSHEGVVAAAEELNSEYKDVESNSRTTTPTTWSRSSPRVAT